MSASLSGVSRPPNVVTIDKGDEYTDAYIKNRASSSSPANTPVWTKALASPTTPPPEVAMAADDAAVDEMMEPYWMLCLFLTPVFCLEPSSYPYAALLFISGLGVSPLSKGVFGSENVSRIANYCAVAMCLYSAYDISPLMKRIPFIYAHSDEIQKYIVSLQLKELRELLGIHVDVLTTAKYHFVASVILIVAASAQHFDVGFFFTLHFLDFVVNGILESKTKPWILVVLPSLRFFFHRAFTLVL